MLYRKFSDQELIIKHDTTDIRTRHMHDMLNEEAIEVHFVEMIQCKLPGYNITYRYRLIRKDNLRYVGFVGFESDFTDAHAIVLVNTKFASDKAAFAEFCEQIPWLEIEDFKVSDFIIWVSVIG